MTDKPTGIKCRDNITGEEFQVHSKAIIFCGGPFTDELRKLEDPNCKPAVAAAAGTHIVLPGYYCPGGIGMLDINTVRWSFPILSSMARIDLGGNDGSQGKGRQ